VYYCDVKSEQQITLQTVPKARKPNNNNNNNNNIEIRGDPKKKEKATTVVEHTLLAEDY
jgi:hypothetical protein